MQLQELLSEMTDRYPEIELRIKFLKRAIIRQVKSILENLFLPVNITYYIKQTDIFNTRVIDYLEKHDTFKLFETKVMDRVVREMWNGSIDAGGSFFALSTSYTIIKELVDGSKEDAERNHRLLWTRDLDSLRHHTLTFRVYLKSMSLRYTIELITYSILLLGLCFNALEFVSSYWEL